MVYFGLSSALACHVFCVVILCETEGDDEVGVVGMGTMGTMGCAGMTLGTVQFARRGVLILSADGTTGKQATRA